VSDGRLPSAASLVEALQETGQHDRIGPTEPGRTDVLGAILDLHRNNTRQWNREDDARRDPGDDALVAAAKRDIDRMNRARHRFIEAIDEALLASIELRDGAPLVTESPGMAIDRLSVLTIRLASTEERAASGSADAGLFAERLPRLRRQLGALEDAIQVLLDDLVRGDRRFLVYESLKLYEGEDPAPARRWSQGASPAIDSPPG
jgi:Protein of unknown function (DUF4254)